MILIILQIAKGAYPAVKGFNFLVVSNITHPVATNSIVGTTV
jgi:hypothetical protein